MLALATSATAQTDDTNLMEIGAGAGLVSYEGDLNGSILSGMQPGATALVRRVFNPYTALRLSATWGKLKGSTDGTQTYLPDYADGTRYEFSNTLVDASLTFEYNFWPYGTGYDYRGAKRFTPFIFAGIGMTSVSGGTESVFTGNLPLGLGVKYKIGQRLNLGLEWAIHFSMSDKLDGMKDPYGIQSSGLFKNTDCYSMLQLTLTYSFMARCRTCHNDREQH